MILMATNWERLLYKCSGIEALSYSATYFGSLCPKRRLLKSKLRIGREYGAEGEKGEIYEMHKAEKTRHDGVNENDSDVPAIGFAHTLGGLPHE
jgi:hypothetical protein